jgi:hypothetical protein
VTVAALGVAAAGLTELIVKQGMTLVAASLLIGLTGALMTGRAVRAMLLT